MTQISYSNRGFPRLHFNGHTFGRRYAKESSSAHNMLWKCTRLDTVSRKRCLAMVTTKIVNGYPMVYVKNPDHTCD